MPNNTGGSDKQSIVLVDDTKEFPSGVDSLKEFVLNLLNEMNSLRARSRAGSKKKLTLYVVTYVFATINLFGVASSADFDDPIDVLKKFSLVILASLAPGFMYLGGMQELIETAENYFIGIEKRPASYWNEIRNSISKTHGKDYFNATVIGILAVLSTVLDATNAKVGIEAIAGKTAGIIAGVGNGIAESILPLFTLGKLLTSFNNDFKRLYLGSQYEYKELDSASTTIKTFLRKQTLVILKEMNPTERLNIKSLMEKISNNPKFLLDLLNFLNTAQWENSNLSSFYIRISAFSRILFTLALSCSSLLDI